MNTFSFLVNACHPHHTEFCSANAVAKLARFLVEHEVPFVLHEAFTIDEDDRVVFESDTGEDIARGS